MPLRDPNDPNSDQGSPYDSGDIGRAQIDDLNRKLDAGLITPQQAQQALPPNTKLDNSGHVVVNDPMNPWPLIAGIAAPLALGWGGGAAAGGAVASNLPGASATLPSIGAGAGAAGLLPASQIGVGAIGPIAGGTGLGSSAALGLPDWLSLARNVGDSLGAFSSGRAAGRVEEGQAQQGQANAATNLYNSELRAPSTIAHNAVKGDILSNARDVAIAAPADIPVPQISGGLRPSMFSPATRQTGQTITQNAQADANNLRPVTPPTLPPLQGANGLDTTLNTASLVGNLAKGVPTNIWSKIPWGKIF